LREYINTMNTCCTRHVLPDHIIVLQIISNGC